MTVVIVLFAIGVFGIAFGAHEALNQANENAQVQTERCEAGNELKLGLIGYFAEQRKLVVHTNFRLYFPSLTPVEAAKLKNESIRRYNKDIHQRFKLSNCEGL